ncbi:MAG: hypothetical protein ACI4PF_00915 [Christensenellales bacterium]
MNKVCFIGHNKINVTLDLINNLKRLIFYLIKEKGINTFLFGSKSKFNDICYSVVKN